MGQASRDHNGLTKKQKEYITTAMENPCLRQKEIAQMIGVAPETISHWKKNDEKFVYAFNAIMDEAWDDAMRPAMETLITKAEEGDIQASMFIMKSLGKGDKQRVEISTPNSFNITINSDNAE